MDYFNNNPITKPDQIREELEEVKEVMRNNIYKIVDERGEKLATLLSDTERLDYQSVKFVNESKGLKWKLIFKVHNTKLNGSQLLTIFVEHQIDGSHHFPLHLLVGNLRDHYSDRCLGGLEGHQLSYYYLLPPNRPPCTVSITCVLQTTIKSYLVVLIE